MRKAGAEIARVVRAMGGDSDAARINMRVRQVLERYRAAIERVYPSGTAELHLAHTNKVIIKDVKVVDANGEPVKVRTLIVYVDDSLFAAELNAQRELIRLTLLELFGEDIEDFDIRVSGRKEYRDVHPYVDSDSQKADGNSTPVPLDAAEQSLVSRTAAVVEDERVRKSLERAMTADLERKKGETVETKGKNAK